MNQANAVGLLTVGSQAAPKEEVLQIGEAGEKQLISLKQHGEERGLAGLFQKDKNGIRGVLGPNGLPPTPCNLNSSKYQIDNDHGYPNVYVLFRIVCPDISVANVIKGILAAPLPKAPETLFIKYNIYCVLVYLNL